ncbi:GNAT family N-acetyltransferase [Nakamurella aerolata]|uniref:GNAT family N-acetyltransferase n=1 Tax=Nakamurella aerolata TaxID=1656892 RepID=A0A849A5W2_9ACTN|nr:GNAT family N-acetyltransferase [Nakamurella aerolata]
MQQQPPHPGDPDAAPIGGRVVIRHRIPGGQTDALGQLVGADRETLTVRTRRGDVRVPRGNVTAAKPVPPAAFRRRPVDELLGTSPDALQTLMTSGLPPLQVQRLGEWTLRAGAGFTMRANSALPIGDPGLPIPAALDQVEKFYAARDLPARVQVADGPVAEHARQRGWEPSAPTWVMTADPAAAVATLSTPPDGVTVAMAPATDVHWWNGATDRERLHRKVFAAMLALAAAPEYFTLSRDGQVLGVARTATDAGWTGLFSVHVDPAARRQRVAATLLQEAARHAAEQRTALYLQVRGDNAPAIALYRKAGMTLHHQYRYWTAPDPAHARRTR